MRKPTTIAVAPLRFAILALAALPCASMQAQRTLRIPADVPTIQAAIDLATPGDTLLVAPGTYFENLDLHGKAIMLRSAEGPAVTILDGRLLAPVVTFATHETRITTLSGFTLRNGASAPGALHGAGILVASSAPTLTGNILTQNLCAALDGTDSSPLLTHNVITQTLASPRCATQPIAPAVFTGGSPELRNNLIEHNDLTGPDAVSAGLALLNSAATLESNILRFNTVTNDAPSAIWITGASSLTQNLIVANTSHCGPAVSVNGPATLLNNTIADNLTAADCPQSSPAAELTLATPQAVLANNILAASSGHPTLSCTTSVSAHHNLLANTAGPILANTCPAPADSLLAEPLFANRTQADYHLAPHSPALDAGSPALPSIPLRDLDDIARVQNGRIDLGAYEHATPRDLAASTTLLLATPNPAEAFQLITLLAQVTTATGSTPTGSVTFSVDAQPLATVPLDATGRATFTTTTLAAGTLALTAGYSGSTTLAPSTSQQTIRIAPATTLLSFALTPSSADETQTVTLSAQVEAPLSTQAPTGQVQFLALHPPSSPTLLATVTLDARGQASTTLPSMQTGTWLVDAAYLGTPNFASLALPASNALTLAIAARGYALTAAVPTITMQSGHHASMALTLRSLGTFAAGLTLSCASLPANATCVFSPAAPTITAGATLPVTLTVDTNAVPGFLAGFPLLGLAALLGFKRRRRLLLGLLVGGLTGCTSKYPDQVPSGTYTFQVVSQAAGSTSSQALPITLIVTN